LVYKKNTMNPNQTRIYDNYTLLLALEEVDKEKAILAISDTKLDGRELSEMLQASLSGSVVDKLTKKPIKLSNEVVMAGIRNKMNRIIQDNNVEI
jgi:hypothetical protein